MGHSKAELLEKMSVNPWFGNLPLVERKAILAVATVQHWAGGEVVYRKGALSGGFYGLVTGLLRVSASGEDGREGILSMLEPGNWFGEASLLDGKARPHDVTAVQASELLVISPQDFKGLMRRLGFAHGISALLSARVRGLFGLVEDAMLRSTRTRVARRLMTLACGDATMSAQARRGVQVSHEELAMMLGVTRQTLAKELKYFLEVGAIELGYGRIDLLDTRLLQREAGLA